jgi:hypothetical protein
MVIDLRLQAKGGEAMPLMPVKVYTASALPITLVGLPERIGSGSVAEVTITVVNADGLPITAPAVRDERGWSALFAASNFATYGRTRCGFKVVVTVVDGAARFDVVYAVADFMVVCSSDEAKPGEKNAGFLRKGDDVFLPTGEVDGVMRYVKQVMVYDGRVGWGASWEGDYVLQGGEFVKL